MLVCSSVLARASGPIGRGRRRDFPKPVAVFGGPTPVAVGTVRGAAFPGHSLWKASGEASWWKDLVGSI